MKRCLLFLPLAIMCACAPVRYVKPLEKGQIAVGADIGGPLIGFAGITIPMPLSNVNAGYGLKENTTVFAGVHPTALAYGVVQLDAGAVHAFRQPERYIPGISGSAILNFMLGTDEGQTRLYPQVEMNAFWEYGPARNLIYTGLSNWFETHSTRAHSEEQPTHWLPTLQVGHTFVRDRWEYILELKQVAFNQDKRNLVVDYKGFGNKGATGFYMGVRRKF